MTKQPKKRPALRAVVNVGTREAPQYQEVGAAWPHRKGFTLRLKDNNGVVTDVLLFSVNNQEAAAAAGGAA